MFEENYPLRLTTVRVWLTSILIGLACYPFLWLLGGVHTLYWASIAFSLYTIIGMLLASIFIFADFVHYYSSGVGSARSYILWLGLIFIAYVAVGVLSGYSVYRLGGAPLYFLAILVAVGSFVMGGYRGYGDPQAA